MAVPVLPLEEGRDALGLGLGAVEDEAEVARGPVEPLLAGAMRKDLTRFAQRRAQEGLNLLPVQAGAKGEGGNGRVVGPGGPEARQVQEPSLWWKNWCFVNRLH